MKYNILYLQPFSSITLHLHPSPSIFVHLHPSPSILIHHHPFSTLKHLFHVHGDRFILHTSYYTKLKKQILGQYQKQNIKQESVNKISEHETRNLNKISEQKTSKSKRKNKTIKQKQEIGKFDN